MSILFQPKRIGQLEVKNRFVRSATAEKAADGEGRPTKALARIYGDLAKGGVGLIIAGHAYVRADGRSHPGMTGIYADELIPSLRTLAEAAHEEGGKIAIQLNHAGRNVAPELKTDEELVAPSAWEDRPGGRQARELEDAEVAELARAYGQAARRAKMAGFDAVQLHAAHGYLINQFLSPITNRRQDRWGGSLEGRMAFLLAVYREVREQVGDSYPVLVKLAGADSLERGLSLGETMEVAKRLEGVGIDALEISGGLGGASMRTDILAPEDEAYFLPWIVKMREITQVPLVIVGGLRSRPVMERVLREGWADFISMSRPFIREPGLVERFQAGYRGAADCISCNRCSGRYGVPIRCWVLHPEGVDL